MNLNTIDSGTVSTCIMINCSSNVFPQYGAGTLQTDASGNITASSYASIKENIATYTASLAELINITPIQYNYTEGSGLDTETTYYGFSANQVETYIPEAVGYTKKGIRTLSDRTLLAVMWNAIKELKTEIDTLKAG